MAQYTVKDTAQTVNLMSSDWLGAIPRWVTKYNIDMNEGLYCDACGFYPIRVEHAHFICPECGYKTKCCEGGVC